MTTATKVIWFVILAFVVLNLLGLLFVLLISPGN